MFFTSLVLRSINATIVVACGWTGMSGKHSPAVEEPTRFSWRSFNSRPRNLFARGAGTNSRKASTQNTLTSSSNTAQGVGADFLTEER